MKLAVIGFGYWGGKVVNTLLGVKEIDQVLVIDVDKTKRKKAEELGLSFYTDIAQIFDQIKAVVVVTPEETHYRVVKKCLEKKKHVLVEKPLALKYREAKELVTIADKSNLKLMVDNTFLFDKSFLMIKKMIKENQIGRLKRIESVRFSPNIIKPEINVVVDLFPHDLAIFNDLIDGQPNDQFVSYQRSTNDLITDAQVDLDYNDVKTSSRLSWTNPINKREIKFIGSKGEIYWQKVNSQTDKIIISKNGKNGRLVVEKKITVKGKEKTLETVLKSFFRSIKSGEEPETSGRKTMLQVKILEEVLRKIK